MSGVITNVFSILKGYLGFVRNFKTLGDAAADRFLRSGMSLNIQCRKVGVYVGFMVDVVPITDGTLNPWDFIQCVNFPNLALRVRDKTSADALGAIGDGIEDNKEFLSFFEGSGYQVKFNAGREYLTTGSFNLSGGTNYDGCWSKLIMSGGSSLGSVGSKSCIKNFKVDGLGLDHTPSVISIDSPSFKAEIGDMNWENFHGVGSYQTYITVVPLYGAKGFRVGNQEYRNIFNNDNGAVTGKGFVGGFYLMGLDRDVLNGKSFGKVGDLYGENIRSVDGGLGVVQDSDLLRAYAETSSNEKFNIIFGDVTGRNVGKRLVKAASCGGVTVGDVSSFVDVDGLLMHATVEALSSAFDWRFGDVSNEGPNERVLWFQGCQGCVAGDVYSGWGSLAVVLGASTIKTKSCTVGAVTGRKREGNVKGTGVYLYNADDCKVGAVTGEFEYTVKSYHLNDGVNRVGDVSALGRLFIVHGETYLSSLALDTNELTGGDRSITLGGKFSLGKSNVKTDGKRAVDFVGVIDGDIGDFEIVRNSSLGGVSTDISVISTDGGVVSGRLRGSIRARINNSILGTPAGVPGRTLIYIDNLDLDMDCILIDVNTTTRGAVGFNYWLDNCQGFVGRVSVSSKYIANSKISGSMTIDKIENLASTSNIEVSGGVNVICVEKNADNDVVGPVNSPIILNTNR